MARLSKDVQKVFKDIRNDIIKAEVKATNEAARSAVAQTVQEIKETYNIKSGEAKKDFKHYKATFKNKVYKLIVKHKPKSLAMFKARQNKTGVAFSIKKGERKTIKSTFLATMRSGHTGVFKRTSKKKLPIKEFYGPSTMQLISSEQSLKKIEKTFFETFKKRFEDAKRYYFSK